MESQRAQAEEALQGALESLQEIIRENTQYKQDRTVYLAKYNAQKDVVDEKKQLLEAAKKAIIEQMAKKEKLRRFMRALVPCAMVMPLNFAMRFLPSPSTESWLKKAIKASWYSASWTERRLLSILTNSTYRYARRRSWVIIP